MRRLFCLLLLAILSAVPGHATERVLLAPADSARSLSLTPSAGKALQALRATARKSGRVRVIIGLRVPFAAEMALPTRQRALQRAEIAGAGIGLRARFSAAVARKPGAVRSYSALPFMTLEVNATELERLARDPEVISLAPDIFIPLALKESTRLVRAPEAWAMGFSGLGQTVAVLDTGVDKTHPYLTGKVVSEACYSQGGFCPGDNPTSSTAPGAGMPCPLAEWCYHGTHVAGIVAGKDTLFSGVARDASIIAIQVFSPDYGVSAATSDILAGLNRVYELRDSYRIAAVNLSLGGGRYTATCDQATPAAFAAVANLRAAGIATVVASGNNSYTDSLSWPACYSNAVSVGAVSDEAWGLCGGAGSAVDKVACFSNTAPFLSLLAPGALITSTVPGGGIRTLMGTSMAAPHVAGAFAVLRQKYSDAPVSDLLARLQNTGQSISDYRVPAIVKPRIDVTAALGSPAASLRVTPAGNGGGTVEVTGPAGAATCRSACALSFAPGTALVVVARPDDGSRFAGWSGPCTGTASCSFTISGDLALGASFAAIPATYQLSYQRAGSGAGSVSFSPAGGSATCGSSCVQSYGAGTAVTVVAQPAAGSQFAGWSGACSGTAACTIAMSAAQSLTATFTSNLVTTTLAYQKTGDGAGLVTFAAGGASAVCGKSCVQTYRTGTAVTVTALAAAGSRFTGWSGACTGTDTCRVTVAAATRLAAGFSPAVVTLTYEKSGKGQGTVAFDPAGGFASCSKSCKQRYAVGRTIKLAATPARNARFAGWSGACSGTGKCSIAMSEAKTVRAVFVPR